MKRLSFASLCAMSTLVIILCSGCASKPFTVEWVQTDVGTCMTATGRMPAEFEARKTSVNGDDKNEYVIKRNNKFTLIPSMNVSLVNMGAAVSKES